MKAKKIMMVMATSIVGIALVGCGMTQKETQTATNQRTSTSQKGASTKANVTKGTEMTAILSNTNWQGTKVYNQAKEDLTKENAEFIGLAKYDRDSGYYEFFDKETGKTRGDEGTFFITNDGSKRVLISKTKEYQAIVEMTELTKELFTYKRMGVDQAGEPVEVFVEHIPYTAEELTFTNGRDALTSETGTIITERSGSEILGETLWNGTKVVDIDGNDVTAENQMFISLAKFAGDSSQYEFFDLKTGESRGDFGYFDVIAKNKIRSHVSIGENKYGAALEITELNNQKFTYKRLGKDKTDQEIVVFVEHEPYTGEFQPEFTF